MSLDISGGDIAVEAASVKICVDPRHPLLRLANALPWVTLMELVMDDLKRTAKGCWWTGRRMSVRVHLAAYLIQRLYDLTDRETEYGLNDNGAYRLFCGVTIVKKWHAPDHTSIERFRSRLSAETHRRLANELAKVAVTLGFADPAESDFDSTVQEANIAYPTDAGLMTKLAGIGKKVVGYLADKTRNVIPTGFSVDMQTIKRKARSYFFMARNVCIEKRRKVFADLHSTVKRELLSVIDFCASLDRGRLRRMPWNVRRAVSQLSHAWRYLLDVAHFIRTHRLKPGKLLSFHVSDIACIKKGKVGKEMEFGRVIQLGRIKGNFLFVLASTSLRMEDKSSLIALVAEHAALFGEGRLASAAADKGYWSRRNHLGLEARGIRENGLQRPSNIKAGTLGNTDSKTRDRLRDRRAGIEALIGHAKHGGQLGRSRMKSDPSTLGAAYGSVLGFNLRQMIRHQGGKLKKAA